MEQYIHKWLLFSAGAITAYMSDIIGIVILFLILFIARFCYWLCGQFPDRQ